jgi:hypothetical protein
MGHAAAILFRLTSLHEPPFASPSQLASSTTLYLVGSSVLTCPPVSRLFCLGREETEEKEYDDKKEKHDKKKEKEYDSKYEKKHKKDKYEDKEDYDEKKT